MPFYSHEGKRLSQMLLKEYVCEEIFQNEFEDEDVIRFRNMMNSYHPTKQHSNIITVYSLKIWQKNREMISELYW